MKKLLLVFEILMVGVILVVFSMGLSGNALAASKIEITFWNGVGAPENVVLTELISKFNETNEYGIHVNEEIMDWSTLYTKLLLDYRVGAAPDVLTMQQSALTQQASFGVLADIGKLAEEVGFKKEDFVETAWEGTQLNGTRYAIPLDMHPLALYYNTKLFRDAGLDPDNPPKDGEEFLSCAQKLTKDDRYGFGLAYSGGIPFRIWMSLVWQHKDGKILTDDLKRAAFDNQIGIESLQFLQDLVYKYEVVPKEEASPDDDFVKEIVAMNITGPWAMYDFNKYESLEYGTTPLPVIYDQPATWGDSHVLVLTATDNVQKMEAGMKLIKFLSDESLIWTQKAGHLPVRKEVLESEEFKNLKLSKAFAESLPFTHYYPPIVKREEVFGREATSPLVVMIESVMLNRETPENAIRKAADTINQILAEE